METKKLSAGIIRFALSVCLIVGGLVSCEREANAQRNRSSTRQISRNSDQIKSVLEQAVGEYRSLVCQIESDGKPVALGMAVSDRGLIVTKNSEIKDRDQLKCVFESGLSLVPELVAVQESYDLALLRVEGLDVQSALSHVSGHQDRDNAPEVQAAQIVFTPNHLGQTISMGTIVTEPRRFRTRQFQSQPRAFLGVECRTQADEEGLSVRRVTQKSAAAVAGLQRDDVLLEIDGETLEDVSQLVRTIRQHKPGDAVSLLVQREGDSLTLTGVLGSVPAPTEQDKWGGGPFSKRRFGFPTVVAHDSIVRPHQCGGPLLDIDGRIVGINIARALRSTTYAVPIAEVNKFVAANSN